MPDHEPPAPPDRPLDRLAWPRCTERLRLRPATVGDVEEVWAYRRRADVDRWLGARAADLDAFRAWYARPERLARTLLVEHERRLVGDLMLRVGDGWAQTDVAPAAGGVEGDLGWVLDPAYAGRGLATEALETMLAICFEDLGLRRVTADCLADNTASWRLMERVGMRREAHRVAESLHRDLGWVDSYAYALLADEWRSGITDAGRPGATRSPAG